MKLLIAGSRSIPEDCNVLYRIKWIETPTEIVCGCARGADTVGELFALRNHIRVKYFPAEWNKYGKAAGHIRNNEMGLHCDKAVIILDADKMDKSTGTWNMMKTLEGYFKPYLLIIYDIKHDTHDQRYYALKVRLEIIWLT